MTMASLNASLLARKGSAYPATQSSRHLTSVPTMTTPKAAPTNRYANQKKTKKKHFRLSDKADQEMRLVAVKEGINQQALIEKAVHAYLEAAFADGECICRSSN